MKTRLFNPLMYIESFYMTISQNLEFFSTNVIVTNFCIQGKTGTAPTIEELALALKSHDLFIYFGHGSGMPDSLRHIIYFVMALLLVYQQNKCMSDKAGLNYMLCT